MRVKFLNGLGEAYDLPATRVLVTYDDGTPALVASEVMSGVISCAHALDPEFRPMLAALGVDRTVIVQTVRPKPADELLPVS